MRQARKVDLAGLRVAAEAAWGVYQRAVELADQERSKSWKDWIRARETVGTKEIFAWAKRIDPPQGKTGADGLPCGQGEIAQAIADEWGPIWWQGVGPSGEGLIDFSWEWQEVTWEGLIKVVKSFKPNTGMGVDFIQPRHLLELEG